MLASFFPHALAAVSGMLARRAKGDFLAARFERQIESATEDEIETAFLAARRLGRP